MTTTRRRWRWALASFALIGCAPDTAAPRAPARTGASLFADAADAQWRLPRALQEISGLARAPDGRVFGHNDEAGLIYELDMRDGAVAKTFAIGDPTVRGDFEGLAITPEGVFYIVESTGRLLRFADAADGAHVQFEAFDTGLADLCEIEGLAYHAPRRGLVIACKTHRDAGDAVLYLWSTRTRRVSEFLRVSSAHIAEAAFVSAFRPSAVEIDPRSQRLLVLSARDRAWAEFDAQGALVAARRLAGAHPQPEGLTVLSDGALLIADEGGDLRGLLTRYPRAP
ncbi:MAG: hypothetical protein GC206_09570 [Alphaproteobacteria bacterium]|nr:hypothetical protein [Alphaproteobacteria bacterium]